MCDWALRRLGGDPVSSPCDVHTPGFARSLGLQLPDGQRREWIKPIMFSGGIGSMEAEHVSKEPPESGKSPLTFSRSS